MSRWLRDVLEGVEALDPRLVCGLDDGRNVGDVILREKGRDKLYQKKYFVANSPRKVDTDPLSSRQEDSDSCHYVNAEFLQRRPRLRAETPKWIFPKIHRYTSF